MRKVTFFYIGAIFGLILAACGGKPTSSPVPEKTIAMTPTIAFTATPTEPPMALRVNGEGLTQVEYDAEMHRLQQALKDTGQTLSADEQKKKIQAELIGQILLAQGATQSGNKVSDAQLDEKIKLSVATAGGQEKFNSWLQKNFYTPETFRIATKRLMLAQTQRDVIAASVPEKTEQVHARQILVFLQTTADQVMGQLKSGSDFETLAFLYNPQTGGDLGWFPRGYLLVPQVEEAAFSLQPGQYSQIIPSDYGFHIVYIIEKSSDQPLLVAAQRLLQRKAVDDWLKQAQTGSRIEILAK